MRSLVQDMKYGLRSMAQNPGFTAVVIITLAVGIGANTAIFSIVNNVLLHPIPYKNPDRLVVVSDIQERDFEAPASFPEFQDWEANAKALQNIGGFGQTVMNMTGQGEPERLLGMRISSGLFPALGVNPILGRHFRHEEDSSDSAPVVMLSYGFWQRRFAGDQSIIGRTLNLNGQVFTVVGVLPKAFRSISARDIGAAVTRDVWTPLRLRNAPRSLHFLGVIGRLRDGLTLDQARAETNVLAKQLQQQTGGTHSIRLTPVDTAVSANSRPLLLVLLGAVGFVLLIACANVANLLLARASARRREIAVRLAIGAGRARVVRQLLTESVSMAIVSGVLGVVIAVWGVDLFAPAGPGGLPRLQDIRVDITALAFTLTISVLTGILFGVAPAIQASKTDFHETLKEAGRQSTGVRGQRLRNVLVLSQIALSLVLLIGAGLLIRSFTSLLYVNKGFDGDNVLTLGVSLPSAKYPEPRQRAAFFDDVIHRIQNLQGVRAAGAVSELPLDGGTSGSIQIDGKTFPRNEPAIAQKRIASANYFETMRIPLVRGRLFSDRDVESAPKVAIIDEALSQRFFPGEDPIGKRIAFNWDIEGFQEIIGVVGNVKHYEVREQSLPAIYVTHLQRPSPALTIAVRSDSNPENIVAAIREQVYAVDRDQPVADIRTMDKLTLDSLASQRQSMILLASFASIALFLAAVGVYGVISYSVTQRTHELGIRMALGAQRGDIFRLVVRHGAFLTVTGVTLGLAAAGLLSRFLTSLLFGVKPFDPLTYAGVSLVLATIALLACYVPARRAARVAPMEALRHE